LFRAEFDILKMKLLISNTNMLTLANQRQVTKDIINNSNSLSETTQISMNTSHKPHLHRASSNLLTTNNNTNNTINNSSSSSLSLMSSNQSHLNYYNSRFAAPSSASSTSTSTNISNCHILCNNCGKNLSFSLQPNRNNLNKQFNNNKSEIIGCKCGQYLPQCVICLKLMKINNRINIISIYADSNRSNQSPKMMAPNKVTSKITLYKSPNSSSLNINCVGNNTSDRDQIAIIDSKGSLLIAADTSELNANLPPSNRHAIATAKRNELNLAAQEIKSCKLSQDTLLFINTNRVGNWFSWCQMCKHGGHIRHIIEWFKSHEYCAFIHCKCQCIVIDNIL
jgi:hypothetical protein